MIENLQTVKTNSYWPYIFSISIILIISGCSNVDTKTDIMYQIEYRDVDAVIKLIDDGADITERDNGETLLMKSLDRRLFSIAKILVEKGAEINATNTICEIQINYLPGCNTYTALDLAISINNSELIDMLLKNGAIPYSESRAIRGAIYIGNKQAIKLMLEHEIGTNSLYGSDIFANASRHNDIELLDILLKNGANINSIDKNGSTALIKSIGMKDTALMEYLIDKGADLNIRNYKNNTAISIAIYENYYYYAYTESEQQSKLRTLIDAGASIDRKDMNQAAINAITIKDRDLLETIIRKGIDLNGHTRDGYAVLGMAIQINDLELAAYLIGMGASPDIEENGRSLLSQAFFNKKYDIAKFLIKNGADTNNKSTAPALYHEALGSGDVELVKLFLDRGANPNVISESNPTAPLTLAFLDRQKGIVSLLLSFGADPNYKSNYDYPWLADAITWGDKEVIYALIKSGANPNIGYSSWRTPLTLAVGKNYPDIFRSLVGAGANINATLDLGETALSFAIRMKNDEIVNFLFENNVSTADISGVQALHWAVRVGNLEWVKKLHENGVPVASSLSIGPGPLISAGYRGDIKVLNYLLKLGTDVNQVSEKGITPLMWASLNAKDKAVTALVNYGGNVNVKDKIGITPVMFAVDRGKYSYELYREKYGYVIWVSNEESISNKTRSKQNLNKQEKGKPTNSSKIIAISCDESSACGAVSMTPAPIVDGYSIATWIGYDMNSAKEERGTGNITTVDILIKHGAKINEQDFTHKRTALMQAVRNNDISMVKFLLKSGARSDIKDKYGKTALMLAKDSKLDDIASVIEHSE